uniref:Uncharacterized protein n=1 Tax=Trichogramma kaykai TaxID=54128 RepID=A0ABD2XNH1_9HYME
MAGVDDEEEEKKIQINSVTTTFDRQDKPDAIYIAVDPLTSAQYLVPIESEHLQSSVKRLIIRSGSSRTDLILCQVEWSSDARNRKL